LAIGIKLSLGDKLLTYWTPQVIKIALYLIIIRPGNPNTRCIMKGRAARTVNPILKAMLKYLYLLGAIISEIIGALATRESSGFTKPIPSLIAVSGIIGAYFLLSLSLKQGMAIGVAYGIWAALGITILALIGMFFLNDPLSKVQLVGILLIVVGVLALELG
jgi:small multidrug resistance pump